MLFGCVYNRHFTMNASTACNIHVHKCTICYSYMLKCLVLATSYSHMDDDK